MAPNVENDQRFCIIFLIIGYFTEMAYFLLCTKSITNEETNNLFLKNIYCYHKLFKNIILNMEIQFIPRF